MTTPVPAHIQSPPNIELTQSLVDDDRIGAFCKDETITKDSEFGPFQGRIVYDKHREDVDQKFSWEVYDLETFKFLHTVDATNAGDGNWMRYVCCARFFEEQNIVSTQNGTDVYYRALKDINPGEELLTWFQPKKKRKRSSLRDSKESTESVVSSEIQCGTTADGTALGTGKRKRKPKIIPDSYQGPLDFKVAVTKKVKKEDDDDLFEPLQPGQKRRRRKKSPNETQQITNKVKKPTNKKVKDGDESNATKSLEIEFEKVEYDEIMDLKKLKSMKKENGKPLSVRDINEMVDWKFPDKGQEYVFKLKKQHLHLMSRGRKAFKCDICMGLYRQTFSLKRHYLRNHINYKYLSKTDVGNYSINLVYVKKMLYERSVLNEFKLEKKNDPDDEPEGPDSYFEKLDKTVKPLPYNTSKSVKSEPDTVESNVSKMMDPETLNECKDVDRKIKEETPDPSLVKEETEPLEGTEESSGVKSETDKKDMEIDESRTSITSETSEKSNIEAIGNDDLENTKEDRIVDLDTKLDTMSDIDRKEGENLEEALLEIKRENDEMESEDILDEAASDQTGELLSNGTETTHETDDVNDEIQKEESDETKSSSEISDDEKRDPNMPGLYRCYTCYAVYDTVLEIRKHLEDHPDQALCFGCDKCYMRFHFKQNLVRHQKVHEQECNEGVKKVKKIWAKEMGDDEKIAMLKKKRLEKMSQLVTYTPAKKKPDTKNIVIEPKGTSDNVFKCFKCRTIYPNQKVLTLHVQTDHKNGGKFMCQYCGKDFPSMPNMKKHVRFHLGYRVRCRVCDDIFSNVGALRKHTRLVHPDIYKARRLDKLARDGTLRLENKKRNKDSNLKVDKVQDRQPLIKEKTLLGADKPEGVKQNVTNTTGDNNDTPESVQEDSKSSEEFLIEHDITFEAHEIDDGGSRFKFSCTVCKKRFSSYINMCRHRRKAHTENKQKLEEGLIFTRKSKTLTPPVTEDRKELELFYANVSHNIAINLNCFIDGKSESLENYTEHIKVDNYTAGSFGYSEHSPAVTTEIAWELYNFPPHFKPLSTVAVNDIKSEPTHNTSSESLSASGHIYVNNSVVKTECEQSVQPSIKGCDLIDDSDPKVDVRENSSETENCLCNGDITDYELGAEVKHIQSTDSQIIATTQSVVKSSEEEGKCLVNMGKPSTGIKALASVGYSAMQKIAKSLENLTGDSTKEGKSQCDLTDIPLLQRVSPSSKTFGNVKNGEYANFDDLMLGDDFTTVTKVNEGRPRNRAYSAASSRMSKRKLRYKRSHSAGDLLDSDPGDDSCQNETSHDLYNASQEELQDLYDDLDSGLECDIPPNMATPRRLSKLCEGMLGLKTTDCKGESCDKYKMESQLLSNLALSSNEGMNKEKKEQKPDYSDATVDSPFYNYDSIAFGSNGEITKVCAVCKKHFTDFESLIHHHWKWHPSSACNFLEVEDGNDIESLHFAHPSNFGVLAVTDPGLEREGDIEDFTCTRCGNTFKSKARLHVHIVNCSPIDPMYGVVKPYPSPGKSPTKKDLHHGIQETLNQNDFKSFGINSQKRVFTGCRKRTAVLLPESPLKMIYTDRHIHDIISGYNPNKHIRRRELTEINDALTCEACGQKFKTIILLERHVKNCAEKEKFKNVRPLTCPVMDESLARIKNICFYCDKNFTYAKSLMNHFQDFCPVKKSRVDNGSLTKEEKMKEKEIMERLQKQEEEKVLKDKEIDGQKKRSWQVGRKPKRKGHSWTYIKKRKQLSLFSSDNIEGDEADMVEAADADNVPDEESLANGSVLNTEATVESEIVEESVETNESQDANGNFVVKASSNAANFDEVDSGNASTTDSEQPNAKPEIQDEIENDDRFEDDIKDIDKTDAEEIMTTEVEEEKEEEMVLDKKHRESLGLDELLPRWSRDANTSLDFTSRYKVNHVSAPKKGMSKKPSLLQCVMPAKTNDELSQSAARDKMERSKRKRERCGKVEAFLQNVFKRKKKKDSLKHKTCVEESVNENETVTAENVKLLKVKALETNVTGNASLDPHITSTNTDIPSLYDSSTDPPPLSPNFSIQAEDTEQEVYTVITKQEIDIASISQEMNTPSIKQKINPAIPSSSVEVKKEESGNVRYLFKRGRPRKHPKSEKDIDGGNVKDEQAWTEIPINELKPFKRGRPRKYPKKEQVEKRPRGRPCKNPKSESDTNVQENRNDDCVQSPLLIETKLADLHDKDLVSDHNVQEPLNTHKHPDVTQDCKTKQSKVGSAINSLSCGNDINASSVDKMENVADEVVSKTDNTDSENALCDAVTEKKIVDDHISDTSKSESVATKTKVKDDHISDRSKSETVATKKEVKDGHISDTSKSELVATKKGVKDDHIIGTSKSEIVATKKKVKDDHIIDTSKSETVATKKKVKDDHISDTSKSEKVPTKMEVIDDANDKQSSEKVVGKSEVADEVTQELDDVELLGEHSISSVNDSENRLCLPEVKGIDVIPEHIEAEIIPSTGAENLGCDSETVQVSKSEDTDKLPYSNDSKMVQVSKSEETDKKPSSNDSETVQVSKSEETEKKPSSNDSETVQVSKSEDTDKKPSSTDSETVQVSKSEETDKKPFSNDSETVQVSKSEETDKKPSSNDSEMVQVSKSEDTDKKPSSNASETVQVSKSEDTDKKPSSNDSEKVQVSKSEETDKYPSSNDSKTVQVSKSEDTDKLPSSNECHNDDLKSVNEKTISDNGLKEKDVVLKTDAIKKEKVVLKTDTNKKEKVVLKTGANKKEKDVLKTGATKKGKDKVLKVNANKKEKDGVKSNATKVLKTNAYKKEKGVVKTNTNKVLKTDADKKDVVKTNANKVRQSKKTNSTNRDDNEIKTEKPKVESQSNIVINSDEKLVELVTSENDETKTTQDRVKTPKQESRSKKGSKTKNLKVESQKEPDSAHKEEQEEEEKDEIPEEFYASVVLSPSERVKTNKRSCKKVPSAYVPVWTKPGKPRTKPGSVKSDSESTTIQDTVSDEKKEQTADISVQESCSKVSKSAAFDLKEDISKALKRKMEINDTASDHKKEQTADISVQESSSGTSHIANIDLKKDIPKALKRKMEIVSKFKFDRNKKRMLKQ